MRPRVRRFYEMMGDQVEDLDPLTAAKRLQEREPSQILDAFRTLLTVAIPEPADSYDLAAYEGLSRQAQTILKATFVAYFPQIALIGELREQRLEVGNDHLMFTPAMARTCVHLLVTRDKEIEGMFLKVSSQLMKNIIRDKEKKSDES